MTFLIMSSAGNVLRYWKELASETILPVSDEVLRLTSPTSENIRTETHK